MTLNISQSVFDKYYELIDDTFNIFGIPCQLVSIEKKEVIIRTPDNNLPDINSIRVNGGGGGYNVGTKTIKEVETLTSIQLKVYHDPKEFINVSPTMQMPDGIIQTIAKMSDLQAILSAKKLIVNSDLDFFKTKRFIRWGDYTPMGIKQNRYFTCFWQRSS
tara:strand:+ start:7638 stop:8120 length:483 start_codon:yes stop_codon:yes gene_type:complete